MKTGHKKFSVIFVCQMALLMLSIPTQAADDKALPPPALDEKTAGQQAAPAEDEIPSSVPKPGEVPEVTITPRPETRIEEFSVNGKLRYIKITPKKGKPYYLFDSDGDGVVDSFETNADKATINQWILMEF